MGVRFRYTTNNFEGQEIELVINDTDYASAEQTFNVQDSGITKTYEGQAALSPFDQRIVPCSLNVRILDEDAIVETLFDDIATSKEGRFTMQLYVDSNLDFSGVVLKDQGELIDGYKEFWDITAVCGLSLLKNYKYDYQFGTPLIGFPDRYTNQIIEILKKIAPVAALYADGDDYLATYVGYLHDNHPSSSDPLYHTGIGNFYWENKKGFLIYESCWDVLTDYLERWNARIFQQDGIYIVEGVDTKEDRLNSYFIYQKDKTASATVKGRGARYFISTTEGAYSNAIRGSWRYMPGLQKITLNLDTDEINLNLLSGIKITGSLISDFPETDIFYVTGSTSLKVIGRFYFWTVLATTWNDVSYPNREDWYYKFQIKIKLDDVYIESSSTLIGEKLVNSISANSWTASPTNYITFYVPIFPEWNFNNDSYVWEIYGTQMIFESASIPKDGNLSIEVDYISAYELDADGNEVAGGLPLDMSWEVINDSRIIISDEVGDLERSSESIPLVTFVEEDNSYSIEKTVRSGDIIADNMQQLYINDGSEALGLPVWQKSSVGNWEHESDPAGYSTTIEKQVVRMMAKMQRYPVKVYNGTIYNKGDFIFFDNLITYRSVTYGCLQLTINYLRNTIYGKWFELNRDDTFAETTPDPEDDPRRKIKTRDIPVSPKNIGLPNETTNTNALKPFFELGTLSNEDTIDTSSWDFTFPSSPTIAEMDAYIDLFVRNTKYRYTETSPMPQNTWTLSGSDIIINRATTGDYLFRAWNWFA